jgi:hypothetical protein
MQECCKSAAGVLLLCERHPLSYLHHVLLVLPVLPVCFLLLRLLLVAAVLLLPCAAP